MLVHKYKLFKMESDETITGMFICFTKIVNNLKNLGKSYTNSELSRKILQSLPQTWEAKVTAIQEAKDLSTIKLEELLGSLLTHELILNQHLEEESKRKKTIGLKIVIQEEKVDNSSEDESETDVALLARKIRQFIKKKKKS